MKSRQLLPYIIVGFGLILLTWWLWAWPYNHLRFYEPSPAQLWASCAVVPPIILGLVWYGLRPRHTRGDFFGALSFSVFGGFFLIAALAGTLQIVNTTAVSTQEAVVRGTVSEHKVPRRRRAMRRNRALRPPTITVRLAGTETAVKLAVSDHADFDRYPTGSAFVERLRRGRLGWWYASK